MARLLIKGSRMGDGLADEIIPAAEELFLQPVRVCELVAGDEFSEGGLHLDRLQDIADRSLELVAQVEDSADLAAAQVVGEPIRRSGLCKFAPVCKWKAHAVAPDIVGRSRRVLHEGFGEIRTSVPSKSHMRQGRA